MMKTENLTPNGVGKCERKKKLINSQTSTDKNLVTPMSGNRKLERYEVKKKTSMKRLDSPLSRKSSVENQATKISPDLSPRKKAVIACLLDESLFTQQQTATKAKVSQTTVSRINRAQMRNEELMSKQTMCGRKKKLSERTERNLVKTVLNNRRLTSRELAVSVKKDVRIKVSDSTIRRILTANDLKGPRPRRKAKITPAKQRSE